MRTHPVIGRLLQIRTYLVRIPLVMPPMLLLSNVCTAALHGRRGLPCPIQPFDALLYHARSARTEGHIRDVECSKERRMNAIQTCHAVSVCSHATLHGVFQPDTCLQPQSRVCSCTHVYGTRDTICRGSCGRRSCGRSTRSCSTRWTSSCAQPRSCTSPRMPQGQGPGQRWGQPRRIRSRTAQTRTSCCRRCRCPAAEASVAPPPGRMAAKTVSRMATASTVRRATSR